jgi:hypothetical protein
VTQHGDGRAVPRVGLLQDGGLVAGEVEQDGIGEAAVLAARVPDTLAELAGLGVDLVAPRPVRTWSSTFLALAP